MIGNNNNTQRSAKQSKTDPKQKLGELKSTEEKRVTNLDIIA